MILGYPGFYNWKKSGGGILSKGDWITKQRDAVLLSLSSLY